MDFLKKHYEKVLLGVVLLLPNGLASLFANVWARAIDRSTKPGSKA